MYFFRVEISSFDDERKTLFIVPEQTEDDFSSVPFSEKQLTQTAAYKQFVKETKTNVVDVSYELFNTPETVTAEITEEQFEQIRADGKLERIDGNELSIVSGSKSGKGGKGGNLKMYALIGAVAVVVIILIAVSAAKGKGGDETSSTGETTAEVTVEATAETTQGTSETSTAETPGNPTHEITHLLLWKQKMCMLTFRILSRQQPLPRRPQHQIRSRPAAAAVQAAPLHTRFLSTPTAVPESWKA